MANDRRSINPPRDVEGARDLLALANYRDSDGDGILESDTGEQAPTELDRAQHHARRDAVRARQHRAGPGRDRDLPGGSRVGADEFDAAWIDTHEFDLIAYAYNLYPGFTDFDLYGSAWDIRTNIQGWNPAAMRTTTSMRSSAQFWSKPIRSRRAAGSSVCSARRMTTCSASGSGSRAISSRQCGNPGVSAEQDVADVGHPQTLARLRP